MVVHFAMSLMEKSIYHILKIPLEQDMVLIKDVF